MFWKPAQSSDRIANKYEGTDEEEPSRCSRLVRADGREGPVEEIQEEVEEERRWWMVRRRWRGR